VPLQLLLALPITVISGNFATIYAEQELIKMEKRDEQSKQNAKRSLSKSFGATTKRLLSFSKRKAEVVESDQQEVAGSSFGVWQESGYFEGAEPATQSRRNTDEEDEVSALASEQGGGPWISGGTGSHHALHGEQRNGEIVEDEGQPGQNGGWAMQRLTRGDAEAWETTEVRPACFPAPAQTRRDGRDGDWGKLQDARARVHVVGASFGAAGARG
jgi:hypothetical protein